MYDSLGVRRASGEQGIVLNLILENLDNNRFKLNAPIPQLRQVLGHKPREVFFGALTGIVLAGLFNYDKLSWLNDFVTVVPLKAEFLTYVGVFGFIVLASLVVRWLLVRRYPKSKVMKRFRGQIFTAAQTVGWLGLISEVFVYEHATYLSWRLWPLLILVIGVIWGATLATSQTPSVVAGLAQEAEQKRKMKWLKFGRKSR
jgi:hypothetical protein